MCDATIRTYNGQYAQRVFHVPLATQLRCICFPGPVEMHRRFRTEELFSPIASVFNSRNKSRKQQSRNRLYRRVLYSRLCDTAHPSEKTHIGETSHPSLMIHCRSSIVATAALHPCAMLSLHPIGSKRLQIGSGTVAHHTTRPSPSLIPIPCMSAHVVSKEYACNHQC